MLSDALLSGMSCVWLEHVMRHSCLSKTILQCTLEGGCHRGQQRKCWIDCQRVNVPAYARIAHRSLVQKKKKKNWKRISVESALMSAPPPSPHDPTNQGTELNCISVAQWLWFTLINLKVMKYGVKLCILPFK